MPRNARLGDVIEIVRDEARLSSNTSRGTDHRTSIVRKIKRVQYELADAWSWPFMQIQRSDATLTMSAGQRYYDFPSLLELDGTETLWTKFGSEWIPLGRGISPQDYNAQDSDADARADPPEKWDAYGETQFEIWPMPASNLTDGLRFVGQKKLTDLVDDDSRLDLDDYLIALKVTAEILAANGQKDAAVVLDAHNLRLRRLTSKLQARTGARMGLGTTPSGRTYPRRLVGVYNDRTP